ncbi:cornichon [Kipferlia bialata]|uniref:Cornichon n=1 Tax=Kipferlia bialata TaxID=797122 RepID=A0A9K3GGT7_9EUKA|nr:cornichon [Kipferlia bialata]|eukprot:g2957.t1
MTGGMWIVLYSVLFLLLAGLMFLQVYYLISFNDLDHDLINSIEITRKLNPLVMPEIIASFVGQAMFLFTGNWLGFLLMIPASVINSRRMQLRQTKLDSTNIFVVLPRETRVAIIKLLNFVVVWVYVIVKLVMALVKSLSKGRYGRFR